MKPQMQYAETELLPTENTKYSNTTVRISFHGLASNVGITRSEKAERINYFSGYTGIVYFPIYHRLEVAERIARSLWKFKKYSELYLNYTQGAVDEDEFHTRSLELSVEPRTIDVPQLFFESRLAYEIIGDPEIEVGDLAMMLEVNPIQLDSTIKSLERSEH